MDLRAHLLSANTKWNLQVWTMIILGVSLFLRMDELSKIKVEDILHDLTIANSNGVEGVILKVKGKRDVREVSLILWRNRVCSSLCPVTALRYWLKYTGIKTGYIFPPHGTHFPAEDSITHISYVSFYQTLKRLLAGLVGEGSGEHTPCDGRRFYLLTLVVGMTLRSRVVDA
jgi:hypothetical protein